MKCEHCGNNEVSFVFQSNINGKLEQAQLCQACAEKLGYVKRLQESYAGMGNLFHRHLAPMFSPLGRLSGGRADPFFGDSFFGSSLLGDGFFDDFFALPHLMDEPAKPAEAATEQAQKQDELVSQDEQKQLCRQRERNALRAQMQQAVAQEDFEQAAKLRDQIRSMEAEH